MMCRGFKWYVDRAHHKQTSKAQNKKGREKIQGQLITQLYEQGQWGMKVHSAFLTHNAVINESDSQWHFSTKYHVLCAATRKAAPAIRALRFSFGELVIFSCSLHSWYLILTDSTIKKYFHTFGIFIAPIKNK